MVKVFKFGGASIRHAAAIKKMAELLSRQKNDILIVILSAMGKSTNALEALLTARRKRQLDVFNELFDAFKSNHLEVVGELFTDVPDSLKQTLAALFACLHENLTQYIDHPYDFHYDQTVCYGELISTQIAAAWLNHCGLSVSLIDARDYIKTDTEHRAAALNWPETCHKIQALKKQKQSLFLTQGFIGSNPSGIPTTLGREGSDYTAAIFAYCLDADETVIWKDVPGLLNADPRRFDQAVQLSHISYGEAIELAYYGATVIHPKTIKPLQNKRIPLKVQSFANPDAKPSIISANAAFDTQIPSFIVKDKQVLLSITPRDFSFMNEANLHKLFGMLASHRIHANLIQTSAISLSLCADHDETKLNALLDALKPGYSCRYNTQLDLLTIRHYTDELIEKMCHNRIVLLEQRSRVTLQLVMKQKKP